ncbi:MULTISPECIES: carboxylesterase/lipase family protein [unclassified Actinomyces]|uniref:carboxylesterase/lipase family protein n=1 Tax=unclassified Actinomyces TaxID=2609248 RepID=UPI000D58FD33|nr:MULTISPECIES: carboxylesterase family protein [unclassified Actinomyces]RAX22677.1 carboxylesterase [Actinomyces sp. Z3]
MTDSRPQPAQHVASTPIAVPTGESGPLVNTTGGPVRGVWRDIVSAPDRVGPDARYRRSAAFYGIPYAEAPVGERRFMAPIRREPWDEERAAVVPAATPQRGSIFTDPAIPEPSVPGDDFLTVNVFTPAPGDEDAQLPVLVWIHGGGWTSGSHNSPWYDGAAFNRDGVVTVSVAYRLGFDGYGYIPDSDAPYNRAVLDQVMALEWVRDNIARFGGDPGRVTIGGQSAGGGNCLVLLAVPRARGLFHGIISESGAVPDLPAARNADNAARMAAALGVEPNLAGYRSCSYDAVFAAQNAVSGTGEHIDDGGATAAGPDPVAAVAGVLAGIGEPDTGIPFCPTVDGEIVTAPIRQVLRRGDGAQVPVLAGSTTHDFAFAGLAYVEAMADRDPREVLIGGGMSEAMADRLLAAHPEHADAPHMVIGNLISDATFHIPLAGWFLARAEYAEAAGMGATGAGTSVTAAGTTNAGEGMGKATSAVDGPAGSYAYEFSYCGGSAGLATHCMEIPFAFDCLSEPYCEHTLGAAPPQALADAMHSAWVRFIETGEPGWEPWTGRSIGRRFGDNRSGALTVVEDRVIFDTDRDLAAGAR